MKLRSYIIILIFSSVSILSFGNDSLTIKPVLGITGGIAQTISFSGSIYGGIMLPYRDSKVEVTTGYSYFSNKTQFYHFNDIHYYSHDLYIECNYYFINNLYAGINLGTSFNFVDSDSQKKFDNYNTDIVAPVFFMGYYGLGNFGYLHQIGKSLNLKIQAQMGLHAYQIIEGWMFSTDSDSRYLDYIYSEAHIEVLYNLSLGLLYVF